MAPAHMEMEMEMPRIPGPSGPYDTVAAFRGNMGSPCRQFTRPGPTPDTRAEWLSRWAALVRLEYGLTPDEFVEEERLAKGRWCLEGPARTFVSPSRTP